MSAETLPKPGEQTLEEQKIQLEAQKAEMLAYGMSKNDGRVKEIESAISALETKKTPQNFPEVVTTGMFLKQNTLESTGKLQELEAEILQLPKTIQELAQAFVDAGENLKNDSKNIDLKLDLLKKQRQLERAQEDLRSKQDLVKKIKEGIDLQKQAEEKLAA